MDRHNKLIDVVDMEEKYLDRLNQISITTKEKNIIMGGHVAWLIWISRVGDLENDRVVLVLKDARSSNDRSSTEVPTNRKNYLSHYTRNI